MLLSEWARAWNIPQDALRDLQRRTTHTEDVLPKGSGEARAQQEARLRASRGGARLWRNNVGAWRDPEAGTLVRYGLCNESKAMNEQFKSSDLIGITPVVVPHTWVGYTVGIFTAIEMKEPGWKWSGKGREVAQRRYIDLVQSLGGYGYFSTGGVKHL